MHAGSYQVPPEMKCGALMTTEQQVFTQHIHMGIVHGFNPKKLVWNILTLQ